MQRRGKGWWLRLLFNLVALGFVVWAAFKFPWNDTREALHGTDAWLLVLAALIHLISFIAKGWAWKLLLDPVAPCRWWVCQEANMVGTAINNASVLLVGEGTRAKIVRDRDGIPIGLGLSSILWARVLVGVSYAFFLAIAPSFLSLPRYYRPAQIVAASSLGALVLISLARHQRWHRSGTIRHWWHRIRETVARWRWLQWLRAKIPESVKRSLQVLIDIPLVTPALPWILLLSAINWGLEWVDIDITFRAIHQPISIAASFAVMTFTNAAWLVRITPGHIGIVQGATVLALLPFGIPPAIAIAAGLVLQAVQAFPPLVAAGIAVGVARVRGGAVRGRDGVE